MIRPTISYASEWEALLSAEPRRPRIVPCPDCGHLRYAGTGPHAPRWIDGRRVDCVGREVEP